jgi:hypothetical protein
MAGKKLTAVLLAAFLMVMMVATSALAAKGEGPKNNVKLDDETSLDDGDCSEYLKWKGGWICGDYEDTGNNPGGKNNDNGWVDETEEETTYKGNSGKIKDTDTTHCVYNPSGNLMENKSDPEGCPETYGG